MEQDSTGWLVNFYGHFLLTNIISLIKVNAKNIVSQLFAGAGITVNGDQPWDIQVHNEHFYAQTLAAGSLGLGETYMGNWWDSPRLDEFFARVLRADLDRKARSSFGIKTGILLSRLFNRQNPSGAYQNAMRH